MKIHAVASVMVCVVGMSLRLDLASRAALLFSVALVWFAEVLNSALESFVDLHIQEFHRLAMLAKDAAAGAVLVSAGATVIIFGDVLFAHWGDVVSSPDAVWRGVLWGVPFSVLVAVLLFVSLPKAGRWAVLVLGYVLWTPLALSARSPVFAVLAAVIWVVLAAARMREDSTEPTSHTEPQ
jgi:diacylglycerol kinase